VQNGVNANGAQSCAFGKKIAAKGADCGSIAEDVVKAADVIITPSDQERLVD